MEMHSRNTEFIRTESFQIEEEEFDEIRVNDRKIVAIGEDTRFELLISFIGGLWMKRWRRFGDRFLGLGLVIMMFGAYLSTAYPAGIVVFLGGILLVFLVLLLNREATVIYCPGQKFKIQGSSEFIEDVSEAIMGTHQRRR
ncbi:MAG: hypothetical protein KGY80_04740 [Candidatus Thorarchaeota archaeon]|nr:hypothetical protein [Candidatus Thorarchaeota archaeon]